MVQPAGVLFITTALLFVLAESRPSSYQYVKFVRNSSTSSAEKRRSATAKTGNRATRSFLHHYGDYEYVEAPSLEFWTPEFYTPPSNILIEEENGHLTPDFTNGLEYPDPLLLTGHAAKLAVSYLYGRGELFFSDIPHVRAILNNQKQRQENGLAGNKLGSLRPQWPFYRFGHNRNDFYV